MTEVVEVQSQAGLRRLRAFLAANIIGYDARRAERNAEARRQVTKLLPTTDGGLLQDFPLAIFDDNGDIIAAVQAHPPYEQVAEIAAVKGEYFARGVARTRRTLASVAVAPERRGAGHGRHIVSALEDQLRGDGVLHITGFMDERNGPPIFYERLGYAVSPRNTAVAPLAPFSFVETHPSYISGQWFHKPL